MALKFSTVIASILNEQSSRVGWGWFFWRVSKATRLRPEAVRMIVLKNLICKHNYLRLAHVEE